MVQFLGLSSVCVPPSTPTGFSATAVSSSQINLSWNAVSGAIGYDVYYCDGTYIGFTANTSYNHTGRVANTTYSYKIDAQKSSSCISSITSCVSATTSSSCTPPSTPTGLTATAASSSQINLSWNAVSGAIGYDVYYCDGTYIGFTPNTTYNHTGRVASTTYSYKIDAQQSASCISGITSCASATTYSSCTPPSTPTGFSATALSSSEIDLSWNAVPGVTGYDVYYCDGTYIGFTANTFYNHTGRNESTTYSYKIDAQLSSSCISSFTNCANATTPTSCTPPQTPTAFTATAISSSEIDLSWNAVPGVIGYDVYYCDGTYIGFTSNTFYNHTGRNESTTYSYKIDAQQSASCVSANTNCVNATTFPSCTPPQTPTAFTATAISSSEIDLSWNAVPGVIGYDVYYCDGTYIGFTANTFYNHTGRLENTTYSYKIDAQVSGTCASSYTTCVSATTFPISPTINISSSQIPPWQREGDDFNGYISVDLSSAGANATWHLEVDYFNTNGFQGSIIYPTLSSANTTQNFSTLTDIQLQIQAIAGNYFTWNVVLESNNSSLTASQQTNIIEKKWSDKNIIYNNDPNGNNEIRIPAKYDPSNSPINITFSRTTGSSSATDNLFANGINFNIGIDGYFHINPNNSNLETVSPGVFDYTIYYTNPFTSESGQLDLTKIGSYGGFHTGNDTLVILIGGNSNSIESDIGNLTGTDPNKDFSIAQNFNYLNATFNTWYIAQPNTNFIENNGYDLGTGIESIIRICQTNGSDIHHIFLLGHSFGGVQIRAMLGGKGRKLNVPIDVPFSTYNISPQIEKVIFLASPHRGVVFFAGSFLDINVAGNAGTEMTAGSQFLTDVDNANLPLGIKFLNITGNDPTNILTTTFSLQPSDGIVPVWSSQNPTLKKTSNTYFLYPELSQLYVNQDVSGLFLHTEIHRTTILNSTSDVCDVSQSILDRIFQFVRGENVNTSTSSVMVSGGGTFCNSATLVANSSVGEPIYWQGTTSGGVSIMTLSSSQIVTSSGTYYFRSLNSWNDPQSGESGICWGTEGSATVIINNIGNNWTGAISTAWENPGNWACGVVPDANTDVVINNGTVIVNSMANCRTLTLLPGVNFTISAGYNLVINH